MIVEVENQLYIDEHDIGSIQIKYGGENDWYATVKMKHTNDKFFIEECRTKEELLEVIRKIFKDTKWKI